MKRKSVFSTLLNFVLALIATIIVLFEEWVWFKLLAIMQFIAKFPLFKRIEGFIRRQNKWISLVLFIIPELSFIPVKLSVVWLFGNHHIYFGILTFICAKLAGTALFAWLYSVTEEKITQFAFVCKIRDFVLCIRNMAHEWLHKQPIYKTVKENVPKIKAYLREKKEHWLKRKFRAFHKIKQR